MLEVSKDGDGNHGIELSLELSIGGCYKGLDKASKQAEDVVAETEKLHDENNNVSDVSEAFVGHAKEESGSEILDQRRKRDFHALRRQEARRKKAEKQKRSIQSKGINGNEKAYLEAQQFHARVQDREKRENEKIEEEFARKNNNVDHKQDLNVSLDQAEKLSCEKSRMMSNMQVQYRPYVNGFGNPYGVPFWGQSVGKEKDDEKNVKNLFQPVASRSFRPYQNGYGSGDLSHISSVGCDWERNGGKCGVGNQRTVSNGSLERTSSAFSDYQSTSQKGGSCSTDTGSHSNCSQGCQQQLSASATSDTFERSEINGPSSQMDSGKANGETANFNVKLASSNIPTPERTDPQKSDPVNNPTSIPQEPTSSSSKGSNEFATKPPKPQPHDQGTTPLRQMPFVSTKGNGPNGKTVNGFLYKYTKTEVSIVCVCHGNSFSPAEFVEHAGGIDISHPLRHITIVPTSFG